MKSPRFWIIILLLTSTIFVLQSRGDVDQVPFSEPLSQMPKNFGAWTSQDIPLTDDTLEVLGKGDFLNRVYTLPREFRFPRGTSHQPLYWVLCQSANRTDNALPAELPARRRMDVRLT